MVFKHLVRTRPSSGRGLWLGQPLCAPLTPSPWILTPQVWSEELFKLAMNILAQNASRNTFLRKA